MQTTLVAASSSSSGDFEFGLLLMPFVIAIGFWVLTYRRYRNQDARFRFEQTPSQASDVRATDQRVSHRTGLTSAHLHGRNADDAAAPIPVVKLWDDPPVTH
jgi:hypothetical protein